MNLFVSPIPFLVIREMYEICPFSRNDFEYVNNSNFISDIPLVIHHWKPGLANCVLMEQQAIMVYPGLSVFIYHFLCQNFD